MAAKMKIFQTVQMHLASINYRPNERPFNNGILKQCLKSVLYISCQFVYLFNIADTPKEFMDSIFTTAVGVLVNVSFLSTALKMKTIFIFIDEVESTIETSKFCSYVPMNFFIYNFIHFKCSDINKKNDF